MSGAWTVDVDRDVCVGNQMCVALAPDVFELIEGKSHVRVNQVAPSAAVAEAYDSCPVSAILVRDENGHELDTDL